MSYILDALRKSDQQRQHGATPTLASVPLPSMESKQRTAMWLGVLAATLFVAGVAIGWWRPWRDDRPQPPAPRETRHDVPALVRPAGGGAPSSSAGEANQPAEAQATLGRTGSLPQVNAYSKEAAAADTQLPTGSERAVAPSTSDSAGEAARPADATRASRSAQTVAAPPEPLPAVRKQADGAPGPTSAKGDQDVLPRSELPAWVQQDIPKMVVSLHAYSIRPKDRLVDVNDQLLHEGDSLLQGLVLEKVTPDGMIFSYKGFRFRQGVR